MKLKDLFEVNFQSVDVREPSGLSGPMPVDSDKVEDMEGKDARPKALRRKWKMAKNMRKPTGTGGATMKGDSEDTTGSGPSSAVNGPFK